MSVGILLNHSKGTPKSLVILEGNTLRGDLVGSSITPYYTGSYSTHNARWNNGVYVTIGSNSGAVYAWGELSKAVDFTKYHELKITCDYNAATAGSTSNVSFYVGYASAAGTSFTASHNFGSGTGTATFDISNLTGSYYLKCRVSTSAWERSARVSKIELIRYTESDFQEVEYIESTGTQHIDTGYIPNNNTRVVCDILWTEFNNSYWGGFGAATSSTSRAYECYVFSSYVNWNFYNHSYGADGSLGYRGSTNTRYHIDANKRVFTIYNSSGTQLKQIAAQDGTFTAPYTMYLFGSHRASSGHGKCRFYGHTFIYDNGTLVREFVPCYRKSDNVIGMWDKVNKQFYTNGGTGTFTKGGDVT